MPAVAKKSAFTIYKLTDGTSIYIGITTQAKGFKGVAPTVERPPRTLYDQRTEDDRGDLYAGSPRRIKVKGQV